MKRGLSLPGRSGLWIVCEISVKSEYWFGRYCRAKFGPFWSNFGAILKLAFFTPTWFSKFFFQVKNVFLGVKNHMLKKIWGQKFSGKLNFGIDLWTEHFFKGHRGIRDTFWSRAHGTGREYWSRSEVLNCEPWILNLSFWNFFCLVAVPTLQFP